jgi:hypothetical protein
METNHIELCEKYERYFDSALDSFIEKSKHESESNNNSIMDIDIDIRISNENKINNSYKKESYGENGCGYEIRSGAERTHRDRKKTYREKIIGEAGTSDDGVAGDEEEEYIGAGCVFTNGKYILLGFQSRNHLMSGIGGKRKDGEDTVQTAFREVIEEIFGIRDVLSECIEKCKNRIIPVSAFSRDKYHVYVLTFEHIFDIVNVLNETGCGKDSPYFEVLPSRIDELLFNRNAYASCEVPYLSLIPLVCARNKFRVDKDIFEDIRSLYRNNIPSRLNSSVNLSRNLLTGSVSRNTMDTTIETRDSC